MPLPAYYTWRRIVGLALEAWLHHLARKEHGKREDAPTTVRVKEHGVYVERDRSYDVYIGRALDEAGPIARKVVAALGKGGVGVRLRGARCLGVRRGDRNLRCVDLRVRYKGRRALVEVKWSPKRLAKARRGALRELAKLWALVGGRWRGKHPRAGKRIQASYVGALCICKGRWSLELWSSSEHPDADHPDARHSGRIEFRSKLSGAKYRKMAADKAAGKAAQKAAEDAGDASEGAGDASEGAEDGSSSESEDCEDSEDEGEQDDDCEDPEDEGAQDDAGDETDSSEGSC